MNVKLKVSYGKYQKGSIVNVTILSENTVTGGGTDFGISEIQISEDNSSMYELGREISFRHKIGYVSKPNEIAKAVRTCFPKLSIRLKVKAYSFYLNN